MKTLKTTLLFCLITTLAFCNVSTSEKNALLALCSATQGDNWTVIWDTDTPVSSWNGVTVENDKVVALDLSFNNLEGFLPVEIGDLVNLRTLNLFRNKISEKIAVVYEQIRRRNSFNNWRFIKFGESGII